MADDYKPVPAGAVRLTVDTDYYGCDCCAYYYRAEVWAYLPANHPLVPPHAKGWKNGWPTLLWESPSFDPVDEPDQYALGRTETIKACEHYGIPNNVAAESCVQNWEGERILTEATTSE